LTFLDISKFAITDEGVKALAQSPLVGTLRHLDLSVCLKVTNNAIDYLTAFTNLRSLYMSGNNFIYGTYNLS
jgi:hypothetical protein